MCCIHAEKLDRMQKGSICCFASEEEKVERFRLDGEKGDGSANQSRHCPPRVSSKTRSASAAA